MAARQRIANDCQDAKQKSRSPAGEAYNLTIMGLIILFISLCLCSRGDSFNPAVDVFLVICADVVIRLENNKRCCIIISI